MDNTSYEARNRPRLFDTTTDPNTRLANDRPTLDEDRFVISDYFLKSATVEFWISDILPTETERERYVVRIESRNTFQTAETLRLEQVADANNSYKFSIDLGAEGLLGYLGDGDLLAIAIAPNLNNWTNSFIIDRVLLTAEAAPVPEPATMMLLGTGLMGMLAARRRSHRKK